MCAEVAEKDPPKESELPKPLINLDDVEFTDVEENGYYTSRRAQFSAGIGARDLGCWCRPKIDQQSRVVPIEN